MDIATLFSQHCWLLARRFDFEAGGRSKWKAIKGATGAFMRVTGAPDPNGDLVGPGSRRSLAGGTKTNMQRTALPVFAPALSSAPPR